MPYQDAVCQWDVTVRRAVVWLHRPPGNASDPPFIRQGPGGRSNNHTRATACALFPNQGLQIVYLDSSYLAKSRYELPLSFRSHLSKAWLTFLSPISMLPVATQPSWPTRRVVRQQQPQTSECDWAANKPIIGGRFPRSRLRQHRRHSPAGSVTASFHDART